MNSERSRLNRRYQRRLRVEGLESRKLLTATLFLDAPESVRPGNNANIAAEIGDLFPGGAEGEDTSTPLAARLGEVVLPFQGDVSISSITETSFVNGMVYTVGWDNSDRGLALEWDPQTGEGREILLNDLATLVGGVNSFARVNGVSQLGGETFFFGESNTDLGASQATIWSASGAPLESEFLTTIGGFRQMTETGFLTGDQAGVGAVLTPVGGVHFLPRTPLAEALSYGSNALDITPDGRYISGRIGGDAVVWRASGDPASGKYDVMSYNDGAFSYRLKAPEDGFGPIAGRFILDSDLFGTVMITDYESSTGVRSGVWSVETGLDLQTFGRSAIMDAINIDGNVYIATNDFTENTGAVWLLGQDEPVYLRDILTDFENPYFTPGGLFALPNGKGLGILGTGKVNGVETHFMAEIKFVDEVFEYRVDIDLDGEFDVTHFGEAKTDIPIRIERSGSYTVKVQALRGEEVLAEAFTTIDVTPHPEGTLSLAQIPMDTNGDGILTPLDALLVLNHLRRVNTGEVPLDMRFDVNGSGSVTPLDALVILNQMRNGDGPGQQLPSIELAIDSGVPGDGFTNDPSIIGDLPIRGEVFLRMGDTVRNVTHARGSEGRFVLPKEDLFELFPEAASDGDKEVRIWVGLENAPEQLQTRLKFAYKGTPPREFEIFGMNEGKLTWEASQGASRYDVGYRSLHDGVVNWIAQDLRQPSATLSSSIEDAIELIVLARDAAGNQTQQLLPLMSA